MPKKDEEKRTIFRRIGGRIVPITLGAGLVGSAAKHDRVRKIAGGTVATSKVPLLKIKTHSFRAKGYMFPSTIAITSGYSKNASKVEYIHSFQKGSGQGKAVFKALSLDAKSEGRKFLRGTLISPDTLKFSSKERSRFLFKKYGKDGVKRLVNTGTARGVIKRKLEGFGIKSTTLIPKIRNIRPKFNFRSGKLLAGVGLLGYAAMGVLDE